MQAWQDWANMADTNTAKHFNKTGRGCTDDKHMYGQACLLVWGWFDGGEAIYRLTKWRLANRYIIFSETRRPFIRIYKRNIKVKGI